MAGVEKINYTYAPLRGTIIKEELPQTQSYAPLGDKFKMIEDDNIFVETLKYGAGIVGALMQGLGHISNVTLELATGKKGAYDKVISIGKKLEEKMVPEQPLRPSTKVKAIYPFIGRMVADIIDSPTLYAKFDKELNEIMGTGLEYIPLREFEKLSPKERDEILTKALKLGEEEYKRMEEFEKKQSKRTPTIVESYFKWRQSMKDTSVFDTETNRAIQIVDKILEYPELILGTFLHVSGTGVGELIRVGGRTINNKTVKEFGEDFIKRASVWAELTNPKDPDMAQKLVSALTSLGTFYVFGRHLHSVMDKIKFVPGVMRNAGTLTGMVLLESAVESGNKYNQVLKETGDEELAHDAARKVAMLNTALVGITDKILLKNTGKGLLGYIKGGTSELIQEHEQLSISKLVSGELPSPDESIESAIIGFLSGSIGSRLIDKYEHYRQRKEAAKFIEETERNLRVQKELEEATNNAIKKDIEDDIARTQEDRLDKELLLLRKEIKDKGTGMINVLKTILNSEGGIVSYDETYSKKELVNLFGDKFFKVLLKEGYVKREKNKEGVYEYSFDADVLEKNLSELKKVVEENKDNPEQLEIVLKDINKKSGEKTEEIKGDETLRKIIEGIPKTELTIQEIADILNQHEADLDNRLAKTEEIENFMESLKVKKEKLVKKKEAEVRLPIVEAPKIEPKVKIDKTELTRLEPLKVKPIETEERPQVKKQRTKKSVTKEVTVKEVTVKEPIVEKPLVEEPTTKKSDLTEIIEEYLGKKKGQKFAQLETEKKAEFKEPIAVDRAVEKDVFISAIEQKKKEVSEKEKTKRTKDRHTVNTPQSPIEKTKTIGGRWVKNLFIGKDVTVPQTTTIPTYGIYNEKGDLVESGFSKAIDAIKRAESLQKPEKEKAKTGKIKTDKVKIEKPETPSKEKKVLQVKKITAEVTEKIKDKTLTGAAKFIKGILPKSDATILIRNGKQVFVGMIVGDKVMSVNVIKISENNLFVPFIKDNELMTAILPYNPENMFFFVASKSEKITNVEEIEAVKKRDSIENLIKKIEEITEEPIDEDIDEDDIAETDVDKIAEEIEKRREEREAKIHVFNIGDTVGLRGRPFTGVVTKYELIDGEPFYHVDWNREGIASLVPAGMLVPVLKSASAKDEEVFEVFISNNIKTIKKFFDEFTPTEEKIDKIKQYITDFNHLHTIVHLSYNLSSLYVDFHDILMLESLEGIIPVEENPNYHIKSPSFPKALVEGADVIRKYLNDERTSEYWEYKDNIYLALYHLINHSKHLIPFNNEIKKELKQYKTSGELLNFVLKYGNSYDRFLAKIILENPNLMDVLNNHSERPIIKYISIMDKQSDIYYKNLGGVKHVLHFAFDPKVITATAFAGFILHEVVHAITSPILITDIAFAKELNRILKYLRSLPSLKMIFPYIHGIQNEGELFSEFMTDKLFRDILGSIQYDNSGQTILDRLNIVFSFHLFNLSVPIRLVGPADVLFFNNIIRYAESQISNAITTKGKKLPLGTSKIAKEKDIAKVKSTSKKGYLSKNGVYHDALIRVGLSIYKDKKSFNEWKEEMKKYSSLTDKQANFIYKAVHNLYHGVQLSLKAEEKYGDVNSPGTLKVRAGEPKLPISKAVTNMLDLIDKPVNLSIFDTAYFAFEKLDKMFGTDFTNIVRRPMELAFKNARTKVLARANDVQAIIDKHKLNMENFKNIMSYAIMKQEGGEEALKRTGQRRVTELTPQEKELYQYMLACLEDDYNKFNQARMLAGLKPIKKVENYFTWQRLIEDVVETGLDPTIMSESELDNRLQYIKGFQTPVPYVHKRLKGAKQKFEMNSIKVFHDYQTVIQKYIYVTPVLSKVRSMITYMSESNISDIAPGVINYLNNYVNSIAGIRSMEVLGSHRLGLLLNKLTRNISDAVMCYNLKVALTQIFSFDAAVAEIGIDGISRGLEAFLDEKKRNSMYELSNIMLIRAPETAFMEKFLEIVYTHAKSGETITERVASTYNTIKKLGYNPIQIMDTFTAGVTWLGAYESALKTKGQEEAIKYADDVVLETQASAALAHLPPIQRHVLGKLLTLFGTFVINRYNWLKYRIVLPIAKGEYMGETRGDAFKRLLIYYLVAAAFDWLQEEVMGIKSPNPTPIKTAIKQYEETDELHKALLAGFFELLTNLPLVGNARYATAPFGPVVSYFGEIFKWGKKASGYDNYQPSFEELFVEGMFLAMRGAGVPGTHPIRTAYKGYEQDKPYQQWIFGGSPDEPGILGELLE